MQVFEMVVLIVFITVAAGLIRTWIKSRPTGGSLTADQEARIAKLEERVRSLEAVVSDKSYELKEKFRELERG
jgi:hypothetical protein